MEVTPQKPPPFPTATTTRFRRQHAETLTESQAFHDEMLAVLNVALNDPTRAGMMLQEIAHRELHPPPLTPLRNQQRRSQRFTPYSTERRPRLIAPHSTPIGAPSMFDLRNLPLTAVPETPQRPSHRHSPCGSSHSEYFPTALSTPQQTSQPSPPGPVMETLSRVNNLPDFRKLHDKPCLRLIPSSTSFVELSRPCHCIFDERRREWIVADKDRGIVFLNKDCFLVRHSIHDFDEPCAVALLNNGDCLGVLDKNGISIYDMQTGGRRPLFPQSNCRGLAVSATGDFITIHPKLRYIFVIPQNGDTPTYFTYEPYSPFNYEGLQSTAAAVNVSHNRLVVIDYTIGSFNLYKFDPYNRTLDLFVQQNCQNGVALCRLTGGFMDAKGRIIVTNCKERICMLFDHDGKFLQRIPYDGGFPRVQNICVNNDFQAVVLDSLKKPNVARLCRMIADPAVLFDELPVSMQPTPTYLQNQPHLPPTYHHAPPHQRKPPTHYLEPGEIDESLVECKGLMEHIDLNDDDDGDDDIEVLNDDDIEILN